MDPLASWIIQLIYTICMFTPLQVICSQWLINLIVHHESGQSEYAVTGSDAGRGNLLAALSEAAFLIGLEINSDVVEMASNAPLFVNSNNWLFNPDAIVFNTWQSYGTPGYWMQQFFRESSGAILFPTKIQSTSSNSLIASAVKWQSSEGNAYLKIKIVNFLNDAVNLKISVSGLDNNINPMGSSKTTLTSDNPMDENSFNEPNKVVPQQMALPDAAAEMSLVLPGRSITSYDLSCSTGSELVNLVK